MTAWKRVKGKEVIVINPLDDLIRLMRDQIASDRTCRNAYEMTIYDPVRDAGKVSNRQCLSFLSFKLTHDKVLLLTVMYRNHAYVARGLGNFLGLGSPLQIDRATAGNRRVGRAGCAGDLTARSPPRSAASAPIGWPRTCRFNPSMKS